MSPKIALVLLICSCIVLGLTNADNTRKTQQRRVNGKTRHAIQEAGLAGPPGPPGPPGSPGPPGPSASI